MKRFSVWTLVFLIAVVDFGYVRSGFSQTEEDDLIVPISGAQGRSVRTSALLGAWSWVAPATGSVTFDTRGTAFDTQLTVADGVTYVPIASSAGLGDGTLSGEVRFTAQQGQTYIITAIRTDFSFESGTFVLNWQAASAMPALRIAVFENPDPGKPSYVIAGDNASLQYWTTPDGAQRSTHPNHGAGSLGLGTTISYVVAGTTDVLAEIKYLDYAMHNGRQVVVVFHDPPVPEGDTCHGMTHEYWDLQTGNWVACLRDGQLLGELTPHFGFFRFPMTAGNKWTQEMTWTDYVHPERSSNAPFSHTYEVEECGIKVKVPAGEFTTCRVRFVAASYPDIAPETRWYDPELDLVVKADMNGVVHELWDYDLNASPPRFSSSLYTSADGAESVRIFYDEATGMPRQILDEVSGNWMLIRRNGAFVDFWLYDEDGNYESGFSVFEESGQFYYAEITGLPVHAGKEITGHLHPTSGSWTGQFTFQVEWGNDLANIQPVPPEMAALMSSLAPSETHQQGGSVPDGGRPRRVVIQGPAIRADLLHGLAALFTPGQVMAKEQETGFSWSKGLARLGMGLLGAGIIATVGPWAAIAGSAGGLIISGTVAIVGAEFLRHEEDRPRSWCGGVGDGDDGVAAPVKAFCHMAVNYVAHDDDRGVVGYLRDKLDWAREKTDRLRAKIEEGKKVLENAVDRLTPDDPLYTESRDRPNSNDTPMSSNSPVLGEVKGPNGDSTEVTGYMYTDGSFAVEGEGVQIDAAVDEDGTVHGEFTLGGVSGSVNGEITGEGPDDYATDPGLGVTTPVSEVDEDGSLEEQARKVEEERRRAEEEARMIEEQARMADDNAISQGDSTHSHGTADENGAADSGSTVSGPIAGEGPDDPDKAARSPDDQGSTSQSSAFIPSDDEADAFLPSETNYIRGNCGKSCNALYNCYRCSALYNSYRCSKMYNSHRCSALYISYSCSGSGPAYNSCRRERDERHNECTEKRDERYNECTGERDEKYEECTGQRDQRYNACKASQ